MGVGPCEAGSGHVPERKPKILAFRALLRSPWPTIEGYLNGRKDPKPLLVLFIFALSCNRRLWHIKTSYMIHVDDYYTPALRRLPDRPVSHNYSSIPRTPSYSSLYGRDITFAPTINPFKTAPVALLCIRHNQIRRSADQNVG